MPPNAQNVFNAWLLNVGIIGGGACLLVFAVGVAVAIVLIAKSKRRED